MKLVYTIYTNSDMSQSDRFIQCLLCVNGEINRWFVDRDDLGRLPLFQGNKPTLCVRWKSSDGHIYKLCEYSDNPTRARQARSIRSTWDLSNYIAGTGRTIITKYTKQDEPAHILAGDEIIHDFKPKNDLREWPLIFDKDNAVNEL